MRSWWGNCGVCSHLYDPCRSLLFATQDTLCSNDTRPRVNRTIYGVYADNMGAFGIGIFVPHSNDYMTPWMAEFMASERAGKVSEGWKRTRK